MSAPAIRVLQVAAWYPPDQIGGTEIYLEGLVGGLARLGIGSSVLVPRRAGGPEHYVHDGAPVETYPVGEAVSAGEIRGHKPHQGFDLFRRRLSSHCGTIYHQHSWTRGCGPHHLRAAREAGLRTVVTVHVPSNLCLRGTMLRFGAEPCEGRVDERICGACWAQQRGMPKIIAQATASLPPAIARLAGRAPSRLATALSARTLGAEKLARLKEMIGNADRIVAVCNWLADSLAANGVPAEKLVVSRQGITAEHFGGEDNSTCLPREAQGLRLLYVGRWSPVKGIDVVVRAIRVLPEATKVRLTVHGIPGGAEESAYEARVRALAGSDSRFSFEAPVARDRLRSVMSSHDVLVVPSLWLETGPLVVLEAQAAGIHILGSRRGGIEELVEEGGGGELVEPGNAAAWSRAIARLAERHERTALPHVSRPVRTMTDVAAEMADLYRAL